MNNSIGHMAPGDGQLIFVARRKFGSEFIGSLFGVKTFGVLTTVIFPYRPSLFTHRL